MRAPQTIRPAAPTDTAQPLGAQLRATFDPLRTMLFILTIVTVSRVHQHFPFIAKLRPALALVALTAIYASLNPRRLTSYNLLHTWPARVVFALGILACVGAPFGLSLGGSARFILDDYVKTWVYCFLIIGVMRSAADLYTCVWAYVVSSGILVWMSLFVFGLSHAGSAAARLSNLYSYDANDVGLVLLVGLALTLLVFQCAGKRGKIAAAVIMAGIGATIARSGSRGAFVGFIAMGLYMLFSLHSVDIFKRVAFLVVIVAGLLIAAPQGYWDQMRTLSNPKADYNWNTKDGRKQLIQRGVGYMMDYPIFGLGMHNFWRAECIEGDKAKNRVLGKGIRCTPPHNSYIEAGAELGIPGLLLWSSLPLGGIVAMRRLRRKLPKSWANGDPEERFIYLTTLYLPLALLGFAVSAFFLTFAWTDIIYILAALMTGVYVSIETKLQRGSTAGPVVVPPPRQRRGAPVQPRFLTAPQ